MLYLFDHILLNWVTFQLSFNKQDVSDDTNVPAVNIKEALK